MQKAGQVSLIVAIVFWAMLIGGIGYAHIVYFPKYLPHLPASNSLITGEYGLHDEDFWMRVHPGVILSSIIALVLNWKPKSRRLLIIAGFGIYALALVVTAIYFVPELKAFAAANPTVSVAEWQERGQQWQTWSIMRGAAIYCGFVLLLLALTKEIRVKKIS